MAATVYIFAKPPRMGVSKTRLARSLNRTEARRIARFTLERSLRAANDARWTAVISTTPWKSLTAGFTAPGQSLPRILQGSGHLGDRLSRAFRGSARGPVIFIGGDAPDISSALIWRAAKATRPGTAVVGPATDGGFWLLGLWKGLRPETPFQNVRWSTEHALGDVISNLPGGTRVHRLPELMDIDEWDDWTAWRASACP